MAKSLHHVRFINGRISIRSYPKHYGHEDDNSSNNSSSSPTNVFNAVPSSSSSSSSSADVKLSEDAEEQDQEQEIEHKKNIKKNKLDDNVVMHSNQGNVIGNQSDASASEEEVSKPAEFSIVKL